MSKSQGFKLFHFRSTAALVTFAAAMDALSEAACFGTLSSEVACSALITAVVS